MIPREHAGDVRLITGLSEIADRYDAILCDIWGVLHNGLVAFPTASEALVSFRRRGGAVVLVTNAPRPSPPICRQVMNLGVSPDAFDAVATSGDVTITLISERINDPMVYIGPQRDIGLFDAVAEVSGRRPELVCVEEARYALCTGLRDDESETPRDYEGELLAMATRAIPMICANPDIVVHRGKKLVYCAGALANRYEELGGYAIYAGKPYNEIYARALTLAESARGAPLSRRRVLAIGDGMKTDIAGAARAGLDALFVTHGIHCPDLHGDSHESPADWRQLQRLFIEHEVWPIAAIGSLQP